MGLTVAALAFAAWLAFRLFVRRVGAAWPRSRREIALRFANAALALVLGLALALPRLG